MVSKEKIKPNPNKINTLKSYKKPSTIKELRAFLGLSNYCRDFIAEFSQISHPLSDILKGEIKRSVKKINWTKAAEISFENLKNSICKITYRAQPNLEKDFIVITDASNEAIGAILAQKDETGKEKMIYAFSKKLDKSQKNYSTTDKELLAVVKTLEHFRHYLLGRPFVL